MSAAAPGPRFGLARPAADCEHEGVTTLSTPPVAPDGVATVERPAADVAMRRLLRIPDATERVRESELRSAFSRSILVSAVRCVFTYLLIPFLAPVLGVAAGVGPLIGIPLALAAIYFNVKSMRRFWAADHRFRWAYTAVGGAVIALLLVLIALDVTELLT